MVYLKLQPLKRYNIPVYPEKSFVRRDPSLLKSLPQRWKNNTSLGLILSGLVAVSLAGCGNVNRGQTMGVMPLPRNILTEDEARQIIIEEAKKEGIKFEVTDKKIDDIRLQFTNSFDSDGERKDSFASITFELDGFDKNNKIGFEFITEEDFDQWSKSARDQGAFEYCGFDPPVTAKNLKEASNGNEENITVGTFYSPSDSATIQDSEDMIKIQVREFVEWLKSEGII